MSDREALQDIVDFYEARSELVTNDADLAGVMYDKARAALAAQQKAEPCNCRIGECESKPGKLCRMTVELKTGGQQ